MLLALGVFLMLAGMLTFLREHSLARVAAIQEVPSAKETPHVVHVHKTDPIERTTEAVRRVARGGGTGTPPEPQAELAQASEPSILAPAIAKAAHRVRESLRQTPAVESRSPALPTELFDEARGLLAESDELEKDLWKHNRAIQRTGFPLAMFPSDFRDWMDDWNSRVLTLADKSLSMKEAGKVDVFPRVFAAISISAQRLEGLLEDNRTWLHRILVKEKKEPAPKLSTAGRPSALVESLASAGVNNTLRAHYFSGKQLQRLRDVATGLETTKASENGSSVKALESVARWVRELHNYVEVNLYDYLGRFDVEVDRRVFERASGEIPMPFTRKILPVLDRNVKVLRQILQERKAL